MIPNYVWYLGLLLVSLIAFVIVLMKTKRKKQIIQTYFFIFGSSYFVDFVVLILFNGYEYKPHFIDSLWIDSTLGSIFSQGIAVPIASIVIAGFHLRWKAILTTTILFLGIEGLFLYLGIYEHHWWKVWYTGLLLPIGFYLAKFWYQLLINPSKQVKFVTIYMTLVGYSTTLKFFLVLLLTSHFYSVGWFNDQVRDHLAANALYIFIYMIFVTTVIVLKFNWRWIIGILSFEVLLDYFFIQIGILKLAAHWGIHYFVLLLIITLILFRKLYVNWFPKKVEP